MSCLWLVLRYRRASPYRTLARKGNGRRVDYRLNYMAVRPPSITSSLPVMKEDSSEARNRAP